jgi:perosamine synthetase
MTLEKKYKEKLAEVLKVDSTQIFLYWKGRVALFAALKAIGIKTGDEVILPAFTCVVVPNAILYLGAKPVYVDIDPTTLNANYDTIEQAITDQTRCVILQNTFGLSSQLIEINALAKAKGIITIEDCTHGFGGKYYQQPNGSFCDFAFFSSQWNKPFSTGIGGILQVNNEDYLPVIKELNAQLIQPGIMKQWSLATLLVVHRWLITDSSFWFLQSVYRFLSRVGIVIGSSTDEELTSIRQPKDYFMASSRVQARAGIKALHSLDVLNTQRKSNAALFTQKLKEMGKYHVQESLHENHLFLKYPILLKDRLGCLERAEKAKIRLGEWFLSPIHPIQHNFSQWGLQTEQFPTALFTSAHIMNLPTETNRPEKILKFLDQECDNLL